MRIMVRVEPACYGDRNGFMAFCRTGDCQWHSPFHVVKQGAVDEARWHRQAHRG